MSLYTPVFPSFRDPNTSRKGPSDTTLAASPGKQQSYIEFLRDVHLFLSTQSDVLSPPSRPNSPLFDHRVQEVRNKVQNVVHETEGKTSSGKWTRVSQTLKLGCVRGRHWSVSGDVPCAPVPETDWILPEEESEWIEWERKREENRRLKAKTNASQWTGMPALVAPDSQKANHGSFSQPYETAPERPPPGVSPTIIRAAKEKVRKWQASVASQGSHHMAGPSSMVTTTSIKKSKTEGPQRGSTLEFSVVKPAAKTVVGRKGKSLLSRPGVRGGSAPIPLQKSKSPMPTKATSVPEVEVPLVVDEIGPKAPAKASFARDDIPQIANVPETPYIPPSFPEHLETSTPLPDSAKIVRAKPSPIFPLAVSSSTPPSPTCADPANERELVITEPHAANVSSCLQPHPPQIDTEQPGKRSRAVPPSLDGVPNDPSFTPPAKRLRTETESHATDPQPILPNVVDSDIPPCDDAEDPSLVLASFHQDKMETLVMAPSTPTKNDKPATDTDGQGILPQKIPSPAKSVKSYFSSAANSDDDDSPMKANLLLESPVSPMLSYAQNASGFLPQFTSTQAGRGSPSASRTNGGTFGMGYSSQFDVERHMDRVSELLEKDVDFEGWVRDVRTVETSQD